MRLCEQAAATCILNAGGLVSYAQQLHRDRHDVVRKHG